jgi:hypothetical protein
MKLEFLYAPVQKIDEALAVYRDGLGLSEAWREGENTVTLNLPDSDVKLMLDAEAPAAKPGPLFVVDSVVTFQAEHPTLSYEDNLEIPGGWLTSFTDPWGNVVYLMDQSTADTP